MVNEKLDEVLGLITRNLEGRADGEEIARLKEWINHSEQNRQYYWQVMNIWDASDHFVDIDNIDPVQSLEKVFNRIPGKMQKRNFWYYWQRIAAILILPLAIGVLVWMYIQKPLRNVSPNEPNFNEVFAAFGTRSALKLADGTQVWLNSGSSLMYPDRFRSKDRQVFLTGEAYFEVESDKAKPFIVNTPAFSVVATGTKFNILDYSNNPVASVTLVDGEVVVKESDKIINPGLISDLDVNQHLKYNKETGKKEVNIGDTYKYISWKDGKLIFRDEPMSEVVKKISQIFNVDIIIKDESLKDYRYWATFQEESLEEILKLLSYSSPISYNELSRQPLPDGSFPRKRILLYYNK